MEPSQLKRLKELESENSRLKRMYADLSLTHRNTIADINNASVQQSPCELSNGLFRTVTTLWVRVKVMSIFAKYSIRTGHYYLKVFDMPRNLPRVEFAGADRCQWSAGPNRAVPAS